VSIRSPRRKLARFGEAHKLYKRRPAADENASLGKPICASSAMRTKSALIAISAAAERVTMDYRDHRLA
jgi:hypothetical protein